MDQTRYFIAKCFNIQGLKKCWNTSQWACNERKYGKQTWEVISEAFSEGKVVLIFSVNNAHGYHGYAQVTTSPSQDAEKLEVCEEAEPTVAEKELQDGLWHKFSVNWEKIFIDKHGEKCLPFTKTKHMYCLDKTPLNQARNFQEIDRTTGDELCKIIDDEYTRLDEIAVRNLAFKEAKKPDPFLRLDSESEAESSNIWDTVLHAILDKVTLMGKIILACPFGSQRYNCHTPESDVDMFIVYQAPTKELLGFSPPPNTIKNREGEKYDYTILELQRFLELLLAGDPRCVETLYLHESMIYRESSVYRDLYAWRDRFLTRQCIDKYLNDACGAKGLRLLEKWVKSGEALQKPMLKKVGKLFYIIIRLLQNAHDITKSNSLNVFRMEGSQEQNLLLKARACQFTYEECRSNMDMLEKDVRKVKDSYENKSTDSEVALKTDVENLLIQLRYFGLKNELEKL